MLCFRIFELLTLAVAMFWLYGWLFYRKWPKTRRRKLHIVGAVAAIAGFAWISYIERAVKYPDTWYARYCFREIPDGKIPPEVTDVLFSGPPVSGPRNLNHVSSAAGIHCHTG